MPDIATGGLDPDWQGQDGSWAGTQLHDRARTANPPRKRGFAGPCTQQSALVTLATPSKRVCECQLGAVAL